jgi:hypothetical protein
MKTKLEEEIVVLAETSQLRCQIALKELESLEARAQALVLKMELANRDLALAVDQAFLDSKVSKEDYRLNVQTWQFESRQDSENKDPSTLN